jgi:hypothetical protein
MGHGWQWWPWLVMVQWPSSEAGNRPGFNHWPDSTDLTTHLCGSFLLLQVIFIYLVDVSVLVFEGPKERAENSLVTVPKHNEAVWPVGWFESSLSGDWVCSLWWFTLNLDLIALGNIWISDVHLGVSEGISENDRSWGLWHNRWLNPLKNSKF